MTNMLSAQQKCSFMMLITFDPNLLAQFRLQIEKEQARNTWSTDFQTYSLYNNEVMDFHKPSKMSTVIHGGKNVLGPL